MSTKGAEWLKHLRPYGKRAFWKNERREAKQQLKEEQHDYA
jgi:hypothetical protein